MRHRKLQQVYKRRLRGDKVEMDSLHNHDKIANHQIIEQHCETQGRRRCLAAGVLDIWHGTDLPDLGTARHGKSLETGWPRHGMDTLTRIVWARHGMENQDTQHQDTPRHAAKETFRYVSLRTHRKGCSASSISASKRSDELGTKLRRRLGDQRPKQMPNLNVSRKICSAQMLKRS